MSTGYWDVDGTWKEGDDGSAPPPVTPPPVTPPPVTPPPVTPPPVTPPPVTPPPVTPPPVTPTPGNPPGTGAGYWDVDGTWKEASDNYSVYGAPIGYVMPNGTVVRLGGSVSGISPIELSVLSSIGRSPQIARNLAGPGESYAGSAGPGESYASLAFPSSGIYSGLSSAETSEGDSQSQGSQRPRESLSDPTVSATQATIDLLSSSFELPKSVSTPASTGVPGAADYLRSRR